jgi:hypothetical protein
VSSKTPLASNDDISLSIAAFQNLACGPVTASLKVRGMGIFLASPRVSIFGRLGGAKATKLAYSTEWTQGFFFGSSGPFLSSSFQNSPGLLVSRRGRVGPVGAAGAAAGVG